MTRRTFRLIAVLALFWTSTAWAADAFPDLTLPAPEDQARRAYLGLGAAPTFRLSQVKASVLIIEVFSMYCPYCQAEAPKLNDFHRRLETDAVAKGRVKIIGLGVGNSAFEVNVFRDKYGVLFPLFPDEDYAVHKVLGRVRTPYFVVAALTDPKNPRVIYSQAGGVADYERFLKDLIKASGLK